MPISEASILYTESQIVATYPDSGLPTLLNPLRDGSSSYNWAGEQVGFLVPQMESVVIEAGSALDLPATKSVSVWAMLMYLVNTQVDSSPESTTKKSNMFFMGYYSHN